MVPGDAPNSLSPPIEGGNESSNGDCYVFLFAFAWAIWIRPNYGHLQATSLTPFVASLRIVDDLPSNTFKATHSRTSAALLMQVLSDFDANSGRWQYDVRLWVIGLDRSRSGARVAHPLECAKPAKLVNLLPSVRAHRV